MLSSVISFHALDYYRLSSYLGRTCSNLVSCMLGSCHTHQRMPNLHIGYFYPYSRICSSWVTCMLSSSHIRQRKPNKHNACFYPCIRHLCAEITKNIHHIFRYMYIQPVKCESLYFHTIVTSFILHPTARYAENY